jgi:hypothetical protein
MPVTRELENGGFALSGREDGDIRLEVDHDKHILEPFDLFIRGFNETDNELAGPK